MALPNFPTVPKRLTKAAPLTHVEGDYRMDAIKAYCEMLAALFGVALNADGTLLAGSVGTTQLADRSVTEAKLGPISVFPPKTDSGSVNAMEISLTPAITAYQDGQVFMVFPAATNTGAATLKVASALPAIPIYKRSNVNLEAGDYTAGSLIMLGYKAGAFHILAGGSSSSSSSGTGGGFTGFQVYEPSDFAIPPAAAVAATGLLSASANLVDGETITIDATVYRIKTTMDSAYDVQRGATLADTLTNLKAAIDASGTPGTEYFAGTLAHPTVSGSTLTATTLLVVADTAGIAGNSIATTETSTVASWGAATLTGGITDSFTSMTHGFSTVPSGFDFWLINIADDLGFTPGYVVHSSDFTDPDGLPAFTSSANATYLKIERHPASIEIGDLGAIDETKWLVRARARIVTTASTPMFPALTMALHYPEGVFCDGDNLFAPLVGVLGNAHLIRVSLSTNNVSRLAAADDGPDFRDCCAAPFLRADGSRDVVFTSTTGFFRLALIEPTPFSSWKPEQLNSNGAYGSWKPVRIEESSGITKVCIVHSKYGSANVNAVTMNEVDMSSGAAVAVGVNADFTNADILNADDTPGNAVFRSMHPSPGFNSMLLFQYNKTKKRIYLMTNESALLHIFELTGSGADPYGPGTAADDIKDWWAYANRYDNLKYVKTLTVPGAGAHPNDHTSEDYYVEIDLATGAEKSICFCRTGNTTIAGSITRAPWRE